MTDPLQPGDRVVVLGLGLYGRAVAAALIARGIAVTAIEDRPAHDTESFAETAGVQLVVAPDRPLLERILAGARAFLPSPGVPERHEAFGVVAERGVATLSEFDLARWWDDRPIAAVTGTDGKTTVTLLAVAMLEASGIVARAVGNTEVPLIAAIDDSSTEAFVVEASSFRLAHTERFSPRVAAWLNFGPDHLDVHRDLDSYERAKAKIWAALPDDGVAIAVAADPVVMAHLPADRRVVTVGDPAGGARIEGESLVVGDTVVADLADLPRRFAHDVTNTLVAAALALELGATPEGIRAGIRTHPAPPHRIELVAVVDGVEFYNDSKATVPHAVLAAVRSFDRVVLIAGGRNKGLDLGVLGEVTDRLDGVVALGESADDLVTVFTDRVPVEVAETMDDAVRLAAAMAASAAVVLLSPGCASYDSYTSYTARGDDFARAVLALTQGASQ